MESAGNKIILFYDAAKMKVEFYVNYLIFINKVSRIFFDSVLQKS
jgi:hypothetical protein